MDFPSEIGRGRGPNFMVVLLLLQRIFSEDIMRSIYTWNPNCRLEGKVS